MDISKETTTIVKYSKSLAPHFYSLNIAWLTSYFYVEPYDNEVLKNPEKHIIEKGGYIFFAKLNHKVIGTVALMPTDKSAVFELTKMAVSSKYRGYKIGQQLMQYCISFAKENKYSSLILYSSSILKNALYIYKKHGFKEIPLEKDNPYKRSDIKMELPLSSL